MHAITVRPTDKTDSKGAIVPALNALNGPRSPHRNLALGKSSSR